MTSTRDTDTGRPVSAASSFSESSGAAGLNASSRATTLLITDRPRHSVLPPAIAPPPAPPRGPRYSGSRGPVPTHRDFSLSALPRPRTLTPTEQETRVRA